MALTVSVKDFGEIFSHELVCVCEPRGVYWFSVFLRNCGLILIEQTH